MQANTQHSLISVRNIIFQKQKYIQYKNQIKLLTEDDSQICINGEKREAYKIWLKILKFIVQINYTKVQLSYIPKLTQPQFANVNIFNEILHIKFTLLLRLNLRHNNIDNIQFLSLINCPQIQILDIAQNKISRFNSFSKWSHKDLQRLHLYNNPINSIQSLSKINFMHENIKDLTIQYAYHRVISQDLNIIMKFKLQNIQQFQIRIKNRIYQKKNEKMIKQRFSGIKLCKEQHYILV